MRTFVATAGVIAVVGVIACLVGIWHEFRPLWKPAPSVYVPRHSAAGRATWPAELQSRARRQVDRARRAAFLAMMVIPADPAPEPDEWLPALHPTARHRVDELDFPPAADRRYDSLAPRVLEAQAHLARRSLRLRSAAPVAEPGDVWLAGVA